MITHGQARSMAEANWGSGGTNSSRTNRRGAFYFSCSGHGGFIIDGRALSDEEKALMREFATPQETVEVYNPDTGKVYGIFNPFAIRRRSIRAPIYAMQNKVEIWAFDEDCDWCIPAVFAGIHTRTHHGLDKALATFNRWKSPSDQQMIAAEASFRKHYPNLEASLSQV